MRYCKTCLNPDTRPDLAFDENGMCAACRSYAARSEINWEERYNAFRDLVTNTLAANRKRPYDCIIPVSGGKDSTYQVMKCLEMGLRPLAVTAMTCELTPIGCRNLHNISRLGVDHIMVQTDKRVRAAINRYTLQTVGDISWPEHVLIFTVPIREAINRGIPLIIYGENPQNEYGGPNNNSMQTYAMDAQWLQEFGGLNGLRVSDLIDAGVLSPSKACLYAYPSEELLEQAGIEVLYLGQFFPWDGKANAEFVTHNAGWEPWHARVEGSYGSYENLDNYQTGIHDYFMYLKFGFGRATSILNTFVRRKRMTREEAILYARQYDGAYPARYLNKSLNEILGELHISLNDFRNTCFKFANPKLFETSFGSVPQPKFTIGEDFDTENKGDSLPPDAS